MKKLFYIISMLFLLFLSVTTYAESDKSNYAPECEIILKDLINLINADDIKHNESVHNAVTLCIKMFKEDKLGIYIDDTLPKDILEGSQFQFSTDNKSIPLIIISPYLIDLYKSKPSIVLSALVHEMQHAKSYFDNTGRFIAMFNSDLENYYYEMDAYNVEANFIKTYLIKRKYSLTALENFLLKSYNEDYLANFSFAVLGFDMEFAFYLSETENSEATYEDKISSIDKCLNDILNIKFKDEGSDWDKYKQTVIICSALKFIPQIVWNIESKHNKVQDQINYQMTNQNPELYQKLCDLETKFTSLSKHYSKFLIDTQEKFKRL